jgi:hypothetical protein
VMQAFRGFVGVTTRCSEEQPYCRQARRHLATPRHSAMHSIGSSDFDIFLYKFDILHVFLAGLEILRLVYKKAFFNILNGFYHI